MGRKRRLEVEEETSIHKSKKNKSDKHSDVTHSQSSASFLEAHAITITAPPSVPSLAPVISFDQLDVPSELKVAFKGFKEPTPIQAAAWPWALNGRDVIGIAQTGRCVCPLCTTVSVFKRSSVEKH